mmetsp:Transcript_91951/g.284368  ORF Transcript_91951/g.284368 Transcript_91951/m.284368 type:complete len:228 (+) Transcript_91951:311-994(+)
MRRLLSGLLQALRRAEETTQRQAGGSGHLGAGHARHLEELPSPAATQVRAALHCGQALPLAPQHGQAGGQEEEARWPQQGSWQQGHDAGPGGGSASAHPGHRSLRGRRSQGHGLGEGSRHFSQGHGLREGPRHPTQGRGCRKRHRTGRPLEPPREQGRRRQEPRQVCDCQQRAEAAVRGNPEALAGEGRGQGRRCHHQRCRRAAAVGQRRCCHDERCGRRGGCRQCH